MEPTMKALEVDNFLSSITGRDRKTSVSNGVCMLCGGAATTFKNKLSEKEYTISGMCQQCQDKVFGE